MKILVTIFLILLFFYAGAQEKTFIKEYSYRASEMDSKISCRAIAINEIRSALLNEVGVYVESESLLKTTDVSGKFSQDFVENIATISAGITKLEVLEESWNGETFWMKASITVDNKNLEESLKQLINDRQKVKELEDIKKQLNDATEELDKLKREHTTQNAKSEKDKSEKYTLGVNTLISAEFLISGKSKAIKKDYHGSILEFDKAIESAANNYLAYNSRGVSKYFLKDFVGAIDDATSAIEIYPNSASYFLRALSKVESSDYQGAIADFNKVIEFNPSDKIYLLARANAKGKLQDYQGAISDCSKAIEINPSDGEAYGMRGFYKRKLKDFKGSILDFSKVIEIEPNNPLPYRDRGLSKSDLHDFRGAIVDFTSAIKLNPNDFESYNYRGEAKANLEDFQAAIPDYTSALKINPNYAAAYTNRGFSKYFLKEYKLAITDLTKAIEMEQNEMLAPYSIRGLSKYYLQDFRGAIVDFTKAIEFDPNSVVYFYRGLAKLALGQKESGCLDLSKAGELGDEEAYENIKKYCN